MEIHLVKELAQLAAAFFAFGHFVVAHFLQDFNDFFAFFTLVFINGHGLVPQSYVLLVYYIIFRCRKLSLFWDVF